MYGTSAQRRPRECSVYARKYRRDTLAASESVELRRAAAEPGRAPVVAHDDWSVALRLLLVRKYSAYYAPAEQT